MRLFDSSQSTFLVSAATDFDSGSLAKSSSTLSIFSLVSRVRASTSAAVRSFVGIGGNTGEMSLVRPVLYARAGKSRGEQQTFDSDGARVESFRFHVEQPAVIFRHDGQDVHTSLDRQVKRPLLERQQHGLLRVRPRPFGEDEDVLPVLPHFPRGAFERLHRLAPIHAVDEHGPAQCHKPAQNRDVAQTLLRRHGRVFRERLAEQKNVQLCLVVADNDDGAIGVEEQAVGRRDGEADAGGIAHGEGEGVGGGPLGEAVEGEGAEDEGGEDAVGRAEDEGGVGREAARGEGDEAWWAGEEVGEGEEHGGEGEVDGCYEDRIV
jgi:hypothetical protein